MSSKSLMESDESGSNITSTCEYEVFLSFSATDGLDITDHLYVRLGDAGIRAYRDDEQLRIGETIGPELIKGIIESKIAIPIFSKGYAASKWCLMELEEIMKYKKSNGLKVMPIFYDVTPFEVRNQIGDYKKAIESHEKYYDENIIKSWKAALIEAGELRGWDFSSDKSSRFFKREGELVKGVASVVLMELKKAYLVETDYLVGVEHRVKEILEMLSADVSAVRIFGIYGMGGIGKTTLAKIIYNHLLPNFESHSFLADIKETSRCKGMEFLCKQLIGDILGSYLANISSIDEGMRIIRERFSNKKVAILVDDVDEISQLNVLIGKRNWFGSGSRIIITTRDKSILDSFHVDWSYELGGLETPLAFQLFSKHAFQKNNVPREYYILSQEVVRIAAGLPLALEVFGSLLCGKRGEEWQYILDKLEKFPHRDISGMLSVTYEALDVQQQQIFLDIACFFIGVDYRIVIHFWEESQRPKEAMEVLQQMSLIKIQKDHKLWMHNQLRDFAREIVQREDMEPQKCRLWNKREATKFFMGNQVPHKIGTFNKLQELHEWDYRCLEKIPKAIGMLQQLTKLDLGGTNISELPDSIGMLHKLQELHLRNCRCLRKISTSIGMLKQLTKLDLGGTDISELPDSIGMLHELRELHLRDCRCLEKIPESIGMLKQLTKLDLEGTNITELPDSIGMLHELQELHLRNCRCLKKIPTSIGMLKQLTKLDLEGTNISELPDSIGMLHELQELHLRNCRCLKKIPTSIGMLKQLTRLDVEGTNITQFPDSIGIMWSTKIFMECLHQKMEILGIKISATDGYGMQVNDSGNIFVPIFSERFVSNTTRLSMEHMVESQRKSTNTHILPIFFAVEPSDVCLQTPLFKESLSELHETIKDDKLFNRWKDALIKVANIPGWSVPDIYTSEEINKQADSVCQMVLQKLKWFQLSMGNHLVGIDHDVDRILNLLDLEVNDVQAVWIWGQDGVGKTTLARAVYRQLCSGFEAACFIEEIDERARHSDGGIQFLQAKMVSDLLNRKMEAMGNINEGINLISERFCHMKVLIVLDDVTEHSRIEALAGQLYWFGPGSRIIITSREECFMKVNPPASSYKISFDLSEEHDNTLLQLFSMHAFRRTDPLENFDLLSREFVRTLDPYRGLPLSIEILGSFLHGKSVAEWTSELQSLKVYSQNHVDTEKIISMSYDSLSEKQKQIFLDISCFPHGIDSRVLSSFCHGSLQSPLVDDLEVLILLSLVKVDNDKGIWMHRLVRDFGKKIVDGINRQGEKQGTENVEGSDGHTSSELTPPDIKFLKLYEEKIYSDFDSVFATLRGLIWQKCSPEPHLRFENVVVLDFSWCNNWTGCRQIEASKLRVLNLTGCTGLLETPDFSRCQNLEMLILEHCSRLLKIDPSIQHLQQLATLNLKYCTELNELPNEVGHLKALKELHLDGTSIQEIPVSIGNLKNLQTLTASKSSSLDHLPQSICNLSSITELILDFTTITELPCSIWKRMELEHLSLRDCQCIESLPPFDGDVESSLEELDVSGTGISELPLSIVKLKKLRVLKVDFSFISEFPPDLGELKNLEEIHASWCRNLKDLPEAIEKLESLRVFKVGHSSISSIPKSIQLLTCLETLDCTSCNKLQSLPELPSSLTSLHVQLTGLKTLPDLANLKRLRELTIESSSLRTFSLNLTQLQDLPILPDSLRKLSLCCTMLERMPRLPSKLVVLSLQDCRSLTELPTMKPLQNLLEMEILHCSKIGRIEDLGELEALRILKISDCRIKSLQELGKLTSLTKLTLHDCQLLGNLCVTNLQNLMELEILRCPKIEKIEGLQGLGETCTQTVLDCGVKMENIHKRLRSR